MRIARKLLLLTIAAIAAMAFAATNASADEPVAIVDEDTGNPCNPCFVHATGEVTFDAFHSIRIFTCEDEFLAEINADGTGVIHHYVNQDHLGQACTRENCFNHPDPAEQEWPISQTEEIGPNESEKMVRFCLQPKADPTSFVHCDADVHVLEEASNNHHYTFNVDQECVTPDGTPVEVDGTWETEAVLDTSEGHAEQDIEIQHL